MEYLKGLNGKTDYFCEEICYMQTLWNKTISNNYGMAIDSFDVDYVRCVPQSCQSIGSKIVKQCSLTINTMLYISWLKI